MRKWWWSDDAEERRATGHTPSGWAHCRVCGDGHLADSPNGGHVLADRPPTLGQEQRQQTRQGGRYSKMSECPRCRKRKALEPAYSKSDGGRVPDGSEWAGGVLCIACIHEEEKNGG